MREDPVRRQLLLDAGVERFQIGQLRRRIAGVRRQELLDALEGQRLRQPHAQQLAAPVAAEVERHHLGPARSSPPPSRVRAKNSAARIRAAARAGQRGTHSRRRHKHRAGGGSRRRSAAGSSAATRRRPSVRMKRSVSSAGGPSTSASVPEPTRRFISICHRRSCAWTKPRAKCASSGDARVDVRNAVAVAQDLDRRRQARRARVRPRSSAGKGAAAHRPANAARQSNSSSAAAMRSLGAPFAGYQRDFRPMRQCRKPAISV